MNGLSKHNKAKDASQTATGSHLAQLTGRWAAAIVVLVFLAAALPLILSDDTRGRAAHDANNYHEPTIRTFQTQWPAPDLTDYASSTAPGYHLGLSLASMSISENRIFLRLTGALFTIGLLITIAFWAGRRLGTLQATLCCLPLVVSMYVFVSGAYLLPDNAGWWGVLAIILLSLSQRWNYRLLLISGLILLALVFTRQVHIWVAAPIWAAAWLGPAAMHRRSPEQLYLAEPRSALIRLIISGVVTLPAFLLLGWLILLWGGLVPPSFQEGVGNQQAGNPATPAFILAQLGFFSLFFIAYLVPALRHVAQRAPVFLIAAAILGALLAIIPETSFSAEAGRSSGFWSAVRSTPTINDRSILLVLGSAAGSVCLFLWWAALPHRQRWIILVTLIAFIVAQSANSFAWQRYHEPFILMLLPIMAACTRLGGPDIRPISETIQNNHGRYIGRLIGPFILACLLGVMTAWTMINAKPARSLSQNPTILINSAPSVLIDHQ